jgi:hypothetical protein
MDMDYCLMATVIGSAATVIGLCYAIIRNFKMDMDKKFDLVFSEIRQLRQEMQDLKGDMRELKGEMKWIHRYDERTK